MESGEGGLGGNLPEQSRAGHVDVSQQGPGEEATDVQSSFYFSFSGRAPAGPAPLPSKRSPDFITRVPNSRLQEGASS